MKTTAAIITLTACAAWTAWAGDAKNLFPEGNFENPPTLLEANPSPMKSPMTAQEGALYIEPGDYKNKGCSVTLENENGSSFIRYKAPEGFTGTLRSFILLKLPIPAPAAITISMRWRLTGLKKTAGAPEWAGAQNDPIFLMANGSIQTATNTFRLKEDTSEGWQEVEKSVVVPEGAKMIILPVGLYMATGTLDIDDIKLLPQ